MSEPLVQAMLGFTNRQPGVSPYVTPIEGMVILRSDHPKPPVHRLAKPAICIVGQGAKWATFGETRLEYRAGEALVVGVEAPSIGGVTEASPQKPCLILLLELDQAMMASVAETLDAPPKAKGAVGHGVFVTDFRGPLEDCALRLVRLLDKPHALAFLHPMIMREICYWLLTGPHGGEVARMTLANSPSQPVIDAMRSLRERYAQPVPVDELAAIAHLSPSAFHRQFKELTSLTPVQYQKQLRLLEARRLMLVSAVNVETAAFEVGYESPSQFSREYVRMFGAPPKRDIHSLRSDISDGSHPEPEAVLRTG
jgi:AraC-like DNA-binding protein